MGRERNFDFDGNADHVKVRGRLGDRWLGYAGQIDLHLVCFIRHLFNSSNLFRINGLGGGTRSTDCHSSCVFVLVVHKEQK